MYEKKHIVVDILPRIFWLIQFGCLAGSQWLSDKPIRLSEDGFTLILGITFVVSGSVLNLWTVKHLIRAIKTRELVQTGPYKYIRHPMYGSLLFLDVGAMLKDISALTISLTAAAIIFVVFTAKIEERENIKFFGSNYEYYMERTKMFIPHII